MKKERGYVVDNTSGKIWDPPIFTIEKIQLFENFSCHACNIKGTQYRLIWDNPEGCPVSGGYGGSYCSIECAEKGKINLNIQPYVNEGLPKRIDKS